MWYVEGNTVKVPKFGSTGTIQADGNITWSPDGKKAMYEGNAGDPSTGEQSIRNGVGKIALKSVHGKYLSAQPDGRAEWNRTVACGWEFFELGERNGEKLRSEVRTASTFQPNPMGPCRLIGFMHHPAAGRSSRLKPGLVQPQEMHTTFSV